MYGKNVGDPHSLLAPEQPQGSSLRPSQSDVLLPIRASPSLGHGPCTVAMDRLFSLSVRALEENKVCVLQKETWKQWPSPTTGWGHAQSFLLPPSLSNPSGFSTLWKPQCSVMDRSWCFLCLLIFTTETRLLLGSAYTLQTMCSSDFLFGFVILGFWCVCCFETGSYCVALTALELPL